MKMNIVKDLFVELAANNCAKAEHLFYKNYRKIRMTVVDYQYLKYIYNKHNKNFVEDAYFIGLFRRFYAMRFVKPDFVKNFFAKMEDIRNEQEVKEYDAVDLTWDICGQDSKQFSFVTKMLNLYDDTKYPIYDNMVGRVCLLFYNSYNTDELQQQQFRCWYERINKIYTELLRGQYIDVTNSVVCKFRKIFKCYKEEDLTKQRIVDIILWQLGEYLGELGWSNDSDKPAGEKLKKNKLFEKENVTIEELIEKGISRMDILDSGKFENKEEVFEASLKYGREQKEKEKAKQNK